LTAEATSIGLRLVYPQDIIDFRKCSISTAYTDIKRIKTFLGKQQHQVITNKEVADYYGVTLEDFESILL
jgi:hypothetical protein